MVHPLSHLLKDLIFIFIFIHLNYFTLKRIVRQWRVVCGHDCGSVAWEISKLVPAITTMPWFKLWTHRRQASVYHFAEG